MRLSDVQSDGASTTRISPRVLVHRVNDALLKLSAHRAAWALGDVPANANIQRFGPSLAVPAVWDKHATPLGASSKFHVRMTSLLARVSCSVGNEA